MSDAPHAILPVGDDPSDVELEPGASGDAGMTGGSTSRRGARPGPSAGVAS